MKFKRFIRSTEVAMILLTCLFLQVHATTFGQRLTINKKNSSITDILREIRKQTGYDFFYDAEIFDNSPNIDLRLTNANIDQALSQCFANLPYTYSINNKIVTIKKDNTKQMVRATAAKRQQNGKIQGVVKNSSGTALSGATVKTIELDKSTMTDIEGRFSLEVPVGTYTIEISYVAYDKYKKSAIAVQQGTPVKLDIVLQENLGTMEEVVVTALGIKRQEKALGYAQQTVTSEELSTAMAPNWSEGLKGKVAGLNIISGSTGPINSQNIQLRGTTSLNPGGNASLIVVDGVPMNQETTAYGNDVGAAYGTEAPVDYGNAVSELKQEDIESVSILKGPSAAALYGSRAANGALIITTKSGKKNQKLGVSYNSSLLLDQITNWPSYQYEYGSGSIGKLNSKGEPYYSWKDSEDGTSTNTPVAYGPKFDGQYFYQYDPTTQEQGKERTLWRPYKNNMKDFYRTGTTFENTLSLQGGDSRGSMRLSISRADNKYITPNSGYARNTVSFNGNYEITKAIKLSSVLNYNNRSSDNLPGFGMSNGSIGYFMMFLLPSVDTEWYKPIWEKGKDNLQQLNPFSDWSSNPYYLMYVDTNPMHSNQLVGNVRTDIKISNHWDLMGRLSLNSLAQLRETQRGYSSQKHASGYYGRQDVNSQEINADFLATYKNTFAEDFNYSVMGGASRMDYDKQNVMSDIDALVVPGQYKLANGVNNPLVRTNDSRKRINSIYGMASLSWKDRIFLDATARNDWSSTLPKGSNSYFYPSVSTSIILSELLTLPKQISYFKYRLSYAKVGSDADPYQTKKYYSQSKFPSSAVVPSTMFNPTLKPEITSSWETGIDYKMFQNRLGLDLTLYTSQTDNQILTLPNDWANGYGYRVINAGSVRNKGIEIVVNGTPIKRQDLEWDITANWSHNYNEILELSDNLEQQILATVWGGSLIATKGGTTTDLWGTKFVRDDQGNIVHEKGLPLRTSTSEYLGNTAPNWRAGLTNTLRYKNFRFSMTVDGSYGGVILSNTFLRSSQDGFTTATLPFRDEGVMTGEGVTLADDGTYVKNTTAVNTQTYHTQYFQPKEAGVFESSFIKLREVSLTYSLPKTLAKRLRTDNLAFTVFGRNLLVIDNFPFWDPEGGTMNGTSFVQGIEMAPMPFTATYGATLKIGF